MRIAICDDEKVFIEHLRSYIKESAKEHGRECSIHAFDNGKALISECRKNGFDAVFLDIAMPNIDGFKVATELMKISPDIGIVFVSSRETTVYSSYEYSPLWFVPKSQLYLLKNAMEKVINKIEAIEKENRLFPIKIEKNRFIQIDLKKTKYIKSDAHYLQIFTTDGDISENYRNNLDNIEKQLEGCSFVRCHERYLVNCRSISMVQSTYCLMMNGERIPISRSKTVSTREFFQNYMRSTE